MEFYTLALFALFCPVIFGFPAKIIEEFGSDPDVDKNIAELIISKGYPVESHEVQTADGYILGVFRIPALKGFKNNQKQNCPGLPAPQFGYPILLQHGLCSSGADYVINFPNESLGFVLSDCGYDVWIGNVRGNPYSEKHVNLTTKDKAFWRFSFDEMAEFDLTAMIDYVLDKTGQKQLYYVGHSQGTTMGFSLFSSQPQYNDKVKMFVALAPVATVGHITSYLKYLAPIAHDIKLALDLLGQYSFMVNSPLMKFLADDICSTESAIPELCKIATFLFYGSNPDQFNTTRFPVYMGHFPAGTSTLAIVHYAQNVQSKKFAKFDWGYFKNEKLYGQHTPPEYQVENIKTKVALFWSIQDKLADVTDVAMLRERLTSVVEDYRVPDVKFSHGDFLYGTNATNCLYIELLRVLKEQF